MARGSKLPIKSAILLLVVGAAFFALRSPVEAYRVRKNFSRPVLWEFEKRFGKVGRRQKSAEPHRTGKMLVMVPSRWEIYRQGVRYSTRLSASDEKKKEKLSDPPLLDASFFAIDPALRASSKDEVDTLVFVERSHQKDGVYVRKDGKAGMMISAYRRLATLLFYDARSGDFLGMHLVYGTPPPEETNAIDVHSGAMPDVVGYLNEMPFR